MYPKTPHWYRSGTSCQGSPTRANTTEVRGLLEVGFWLRRVFLLFFSVKGGGGGGGGAGRGGGTTGR